MKRLLIFLLIISIELIIVSCAIGKVTGQCSNCHTMHNSQNGVDLSATPYPVLLVKNCIGCHSHGSETQTYLIGSCVTPVVNFTGGEPSYHLAGGNFYWVADDGEDDDTKGHNVYGISGSDQYNTPAKGAPGDNMGCGPGSCHATLALATSTGPSVMPGGCQGCHLNVRHHANDGVGTKYVGTESQGWYRFLAGHYGGPATAVGVHGIEDVDWQKTTMGHDHNEYKGLTGEGAGSLNSGSGTMTAFCSGCHGAYHSDQSTDSGWIRHPSDLEIPNTPGSEYADAFGANGTGLGTYTSSVPVARPSSFDGFNSGSELGDPSELVNIGTDMVMCLSCHRPHGSPYKDLLRFQYNGLGGIIAGSGESTNGCFACHTKKDLP